MKNTLKEFLEMEYDRAIALKNEFKKTENKEWGALEVIDELLVQVGHYGFVIKSSEYSKEIGRKINDRDDEISDILLQLCALCYKLNIKKEEIDLKEFCCKSVEESFISLIVLLGQLCEGIMEKYGYRHSKPRQGFKNIDEFIIDRISRIFTIIFITEKDCDFIRAFEMMCEDAENFLKNFEKRQ